jgi:hypothetical protein
MLRAPLINEFTKAEEFASFVENSHEKKGSPIEMVPAVSWEQTWVRKNDPDDETKYMLFSKLDRRK